MNPSRLHCVRNHMAAQGLDQILVTSTASVYYLTGLWIEPHERMLALYIDKEGRVCLCGNNIFGLQSAADLPVLCHSDNENPVSDLAGIVRPGPIGIDKAWPSKFLIGLMEARPDIKPVLGSAPIDTARRYKDEMERVALRRASRINDKVVETAIQAVREGITEAELAALVNQTFRENGADSEGTQLVCFGPNAADPHHIAGPTVIQPGDCIVLDIFTPIGRYWCDMTRTVYFQSANKKQRQLHELVRAANQAGIDAVRPGVPLREVDRAARKVIEEAGFGPYFTHRLGHGLGLECHEPPDVSAASEALAQPGMVFSIEPGIYLPGETGVRLEDLVLVTETGAEVLNAADKTFRIVG